jgi:hypothetical protein
MLAPFIPSFVHWPLLRLSTIPFSSHHRPASMSTPFITLTPNITNYNPQDPRIDGKEQQTR